ncbi:SOS response-associated peptidase family protein [Ciceribacter sp. T2.26MG-112.2]|uniref:SOS response-associated peptidase family protein n=1 Tax=Ciceribacter sp. T2.26MG-112.2 TaxID=3137154 RepID=UPI001AECC223|nr:SOS response-associated peptidase family protein [Ciceribacter naphthalenivorans]
MALAEDNEDMFQCPRRTVFRWAGLWRVSDEWGPVYSGVMTGANEAVSTVHDRMLVLFRRREYELWLHGDFEMERTTDLWVKKKAAAADLQALSI